MEIKTLLVLVVIAGIAFIFYKFAMKKIDRWEPKKGTIATRQKHRSF